MSAPRIELAGKIAVVTGAAQGIGAAISGALTAAGARVVLVDRPGSDVNDVADRLGGGATALEGDLADSAFAAGVIDDVVRRSGGVDILVNNAGRRGVHPFREYPLEDWELTMAVNVTAPFLLCRGAAESMISRGGGRIVNIASTAASLAFKNRAAYNASKAAVVMLTKSIAVELGGEGIRCNAIAPGVIETPLNAAYLRTGPEAPIIIEGTPNGGWGQPQDVAGAVRFLCGPGADFINGTVLHVDGGWTAGKGY
jgi:NAD(P)-dependent dehydrogenase (short-subunit alcohol dehydrogenase family)